MCYTCKPADRRTSKRTETETAGLKAPPVEELPVALGTRLLDDNGTVAEGTDDKDGVPAGVLVLDNELLEITELEITELELPEAMELVEAPPPSLADELEELLADVVVLLLVVVDAPPPCWASAAARKAATVSFGPGLTIITMPIPQCGMQCT